MLLLNTKFHVDRSMDRTAFMRMVEAQLNASQKSVVTLSGCNWAEQDDTFVSAENESVVVNNYDDALILQLTVGRPEDSSGAYITTFVLRDKDEDPTMYASVEFERSAISLELDGNRAFTPEILRAVFWNEYGGEDGWLDTDDKPRILRKSDVKPLVDTLSAQGGTTGLMNPIVYVSVKPNGERVVECDNLAALLAGSAHVLVEGSPVVSAMVAAAMPDDRPLPCDGGVGIYLPSGERVVMPDDGSDLTVITMSKVHDLLRTVAVDGKYNVSKLRHSHLLSKMGGDSELSRLCDELLTEKEAEITRLKAEAQDLRRELAGARSKIDGLQDGLEKSGQTEGGKFITLSVTDNDLYEGEIRDMILNTLDQVRRSMEDNIQLKRCRKFHVLVDVLEHNFPCQRGVDLRDGIRGAFKDGTLTREGIGRLRDLGFVVTKEGRGAHYKIRLGDDERYTAICSTTPSDKARSGKNMVSEFTNLFFGF